MKQETLNLRLLSKTEYSGNIFLAIAGYILSSFFQPYFYSLKKVFQFYDAQILFLLLLLSEYYILIKAAFELSIDKADITRNQLNK